jgi:hypothetical protein
MVPYFEAAGVILISVLSIILGRVFSGLKKPYWTFGYFFPCLFIAVLVIARLDDSLCFNRPFCWFVAGRSRYVVLSFAVCMGLTVPLSRLPRRFEKILVCILMFIFVTWFSVMPFLFPVILKGKLLSKATCYDKDGICRQTTNYTCGPAAAVTALEHLGLNAREGEIAVLSQSSPVVGTLPTMLCAALEKRFSQDGLRCEYRRFDSVEQLRKTGVTLVVIKEGFLLDHCIVVLEVLENTVAVADPMTGKELIPIEQFEKIWRFSGIILERETTQSI